MKTVRAIDFLGGSSLPAAVLNLDGGIEWRNDAFKKLVDDPSADHDHVLDVIADRDHSAISHFGQRIQETGHLRRTIWMHRSDLEFLADAEAVAVGERVLVTFRDLSRPDLDSSSPWPLLESFAGLGHWRTSPDGLLCEASPEVFRIFGLEPRSQAIETQEFTQHFLPDEMDRIAETAKPRIQAGLPFEIETLVYRNDGEVAEVLVRGVAQVDEDDSFVGTLGTIQDMTNRNARRRREAAKGRANALSTFAAGVTHELNTPLAVIATNVAFIREQMRVDDDEDLVGALDDVLRNLDRARSIVDKLKPVAHLDDGPLNEIDIAEVLKTVVRESEPDIRHVAAIELTIEPTLPTLVGNRSRLVQGLLGVIVNAGQAIEESDKARGTISITAAADRDGVGLTIEDDGVGIAPEHIPQLFDPFFTTREVGSGHGLGLAVLRNVVDEFDGTVEFSSPPGGGARVSIFLPAEGTLRATPIVLHRPTVGENRT